MSVYAPPPVDAASPPGAAAPSSERNPIVLIASGEMGWRRFDHLISSMLAGEGYWVGGIDAMRYFWEPQDDRQALASDLRAYAAALAQAAGRAPEAPLILGGFSFGADLAPFVAGTKGWGNQVRGLLMIGPDATGSLQFRLSEMIGFQPKEHTFQVAEALEGAAGTAVLFIHGEKDRTSAALQLLGHASEPKRLITVPGAGHHFSGQEERLRAALREGMEWLLHEGAPKAGSRRRVP